MVAVGRSNPTWGICNFLVNLFFQNFFVWQIFCQICLSWKTRLSTSKNPRSVADYFLSRSLPRSLQFIIKFNTIIIDDLEKLKQKISMISFQKWSCKQIWGTQWKWRKLRQNFCVHIFYGKLLHRHKLTDQSLHPKTRIFNNTQGVYNRLWHLEKKTDDDI